MKKTAVARANIALVKYWGKRNSKLNLPATGSISMTLNALSTKTTVEFFDGFDADTLHINDQRATSLQENRVSNFLDLIRDLAGIKLSASVISHNNFPTAAGLASSASGFAALTVAACAAAKLDYSASRLSEIARRGSGSAARSIYGGFVEMKTGQKPDGSDSVAVQLYEESYWPLELLILITSHSPKETGSTEGMNSTAETSPYYQNWIDSSKQDIAELRSALAQKDFQKLGEVSEHSCFKMHGLALSAKPSILYWNGITVSLIREIFNLRKKGFPVYITIDAGPQVKVITLPGYSRKIKSELEGIEGIKEILVSSIGGGARVINV